MLPSSIHENALTIWLMAGLRSDKTHSLYFKDVCQILSNIHMDTPAQYRLIRQLHSLEEYRVDIRKLQDVKTSIHFDAGFSVIREHATQSAVVIAENGERYIHKKTLSLSDALEEAKSLDFLKSPQKVTSHMAEKIAGFSAITLASQLHGCKSILGDNKTVIQEFREMHYDMMYWHSRKHNAEANFWATAHYAH